MADPNASDFESQIAAAEAQIADLQKLRDIASLDGIKAVKALLNTGKLATMEEDLSALLVQVGAATTIGQNVNTLIAVMKGTRENIEREIARIQPLADAQTPEG